MINFDALKISDEFVAKESWNETVEHLQTYFNGDMDIPGNIGIGATASSPKLLVSTTTKNTGDNTARFSALSIGPRNSHIHWGTKGDWYIRSAHASGKVVIQDNGGNVGIGTSSPSARLQVHGSGGTNIDLIVNGRIKSNNNSGGLWVSSNRLIGGHATNKLGLYNSGWRLTVLNNGNVGIGTTNPTARLQVRGSGGASVDLIVNGRIKSDNNSGGLWVASNRFIGGHATNKLGFYSNNAWRLTVQTNGHVGIGTTSPIERLHVVGNIKTTGKIFAKLRYIGDKKNVQYNTSTGEIGYDNSTRRDKRNITPLKDDFGKIMQLQPRTYTRPFDPKNWEIGYIAEEAESLGLERLLYYNENDEVDGVNYRKLCLYMMEILRDHESKLNPNSPYLKKHIEDDLPRPNLKSKIKDIKYYLDFYRVPYNKGESKEELLKKVNTMN